MFSLEFSDHSFQSLLLNWRFQLLAEWLEVASADLYKKKQLHVLWTDAASLVSLCCFIIFRFLVILNYVL